MTDFNYCGIDFGRTKNGYWNFRSFLPGSALRWGYWERFLTRTEQKQLDPESDLPIEQQKKIMHNAIDRAFKDNPVYTGDIRERHLEGKG